MQEKVIDNKNRLIVKSSSTWIKYRKIETLGILSAYLVLLVGVTILDRRNFLKDLVLLCVLLCLIMPLWLWMVWNEYSCAMKSHFRKFGNQMSGSGNHLCNYASLLA